MQLLWAVAHGLESRSMRMRVAVGITGPQRLVLRLIGHFGQTTPGKLAEVLHVHPSSLTGILSRLERAELIVRKSDPVDRRRAFLTLTRRGRGLSDQRSGTVEDVVHQTLRQVPPSKIATVHEVLSALADALDVEQELARSARVSERPRNATARRRRAGRGAAKRART